MQINDLTQVSGIGQSRAKYLAERGIHTIEDLKKMSVDDLASVKTIGPRNAEKILARLNGESQSTPEKKASSKPAKAKKKATTATPREVKKPKKESHIFEEIIQMMDPKPLKLVRKAKSSIGELQDVLEEGLEKLKPLGKKKLLKEYVKYKVHAKKLDKNLKKVVSNIEELPKKTTKSLVKASEGLRGQVQELWKGVKKKRFNSVNRDLEAFYQLVKTLKKGK